MRLHWYCVTFAGPNGMVCSTYCGAEYMGGFGKSWIEGRKANAAPGVDPKNLCLLALIYLGEGTKEEFERP